MLCSLTNTYRFETCPDKYMKKTAQKISEKEGGGRSSKKPSKKSMWVIKFVGFVLSFFFLSFAFSFFRRFPLVMR